MKLLTAERELVGKQILYTEFVLIDGHILGLKIVFENSYCLVASTAEESRYSFTSASYKKIRLFKKVTTVKSFLPKNEKSSSHRELKKKVIRGVFPKSRGQLVFTFEDNSLCVLKQSCFGIDYYFPDPTKLGLTFRSILTLEKWLGDLSHTNPHT